MVDNFKSYLFFKLYSVKQAPQNNLYLIFCFIVQNFLRFYLPQYNLQEHNHHLFLCRYPFCVHYYLEWNFRNKYWI